MSVDELSDVGGGGGSTLLCIVLPTFKILLYYRYLVSVSIVNTYVCIFGVLPVTLFFGHKVSMSLYLAKHLIVENELREF